MAALAAVFSTLIFMAGPPSGERVQITYPIHADDIANPERGFHEQTFAYVGVQGPSTPYTRLSQNLNVSDQQGLAFRKITVVQRLISLENYAGVDDLPIAFLTNVQNDLADAKALNIKLNLRFAYTFDGDGTYVDPPIARIERHITQLGNLLSLNDNADVVTHLDAGMLGRYGEWAFTPTQEMKTRVVNRWLAVLPETLTVAVRTPEQKQAIFGALPLASGFDGTDAARVGHHDDCYLASLTDYGTYSASFAERETQKNYLRDDNRFVPMSGETCGFFDPAAQTGIECGPGEDCVSRSSCPTALAESARLRWSLLNTRWFDQLVLPPNGQWLVGPNACYGEMKRRLGYRIELVSADLPATASVGDCGWNASVTLRNAGFASPFGPRELQLILEPAAGGTQTTVNLLQANSPTRDPRRWLPDNGNIVVSLGNQLPATLPPGNYQLHLAMPDGHVSLRNLPAYAIQTANTGLWNSTHGWNSLNHTVNVTACTRYSVGGSIGGLHNGASLTLHNTATGEALVRGVNGAFAFVTTQPAGASYDVVVQAQPAGQQCSVANGNGSVGTGNVTSIAVTCQNVSASTQTVVVSAVPANARLGQPVTVTFAVTSDTGTPGGTVTVGDGLSSCTAGVAATGAGVATGTCELRLYRAGNASLRANYAGDGSHLPSQSAVVGYTVARYRRDAAVTVAPPVASAGQPVDLGVVFAALPTPPANDPAYPATSGSLTFSSTQGAACSTALPSTSCQATFASTSGADLAVTGSYSGDGNYEPVAATPAQVAIVDGSRSEDCPGGPGGDPRGCYGHSGVIFDGVALSYPANPSFGFSSATPAQPGTLQVNQQGTFATNSPVPLTRLSSNVADSRCRWYLDNASAFSITGRPPAYAGDSQRCGFALGAAFFPDRTFTLNADRTLEVFAYTVPAGSCRSTRRSPAPLVDLLTPQRNEYLPGRLRETYDEPFRILQFMPDCVFSDGFDPPRQ